MKLKLKREVCSIKYYIKGGEGLKPNELVFNLRKVLTQRKKKKGDKKCSNPGKTEKRYN